LRLERRASAGPINDPSALAGPINETTRLAPLTGVSADASQAATPPTVLTDETRFARLPTVLLYSL